MMKSKEVGCPMKGKLEAEQIWGPERLSHIDVVKTTSPGNAVIDGGGEVFSRIEDGN